MNKKKMFKLTILLKLSSTGTLIEKDGQAEEEKRVRSKKYVVRRKRREKREKGGEEGKRQKAEGKREERRL